MKSTIVGLLLVILALAGAVCFGLLATGRSAVLAELPSVAVSCYLPVIVDHYPPLPTTTHTPMPTPTRTPAPLAVLTSIPLGAPAGLAADPATGRVYVADDGTNSIVVLDDASRTVVQTFPLAGHVSAVAFDPATNRLFAGYGTPIRVLNAATGAQLITLSESIYDDYEIAINPTNRKLYLGDWTVLVGNSDKVLIYDADTLAKLGEVSLGVDTAIQRVAVAVNPTTGMAYAAYSARDEVTFLGEVTNEVVRVVPLGEDITKSPAIAVDPVADRIYVKCAAETVVLDGTSGARLGTIPGYYDTRVTPGHGRIYQTMNKSFRVLDGETYAVVAQLTLPGYAVSGAMAMLPGSGRVYLATSIPNQVVVIQD